LRVSVASLRPLILQPGARSKIADRRLGHQDRVRIRVDDVTGSPERWSAIAVRPMIGEQLAAAPTLR
jgi:hypothetical protein